MNIRETSQSCGMETFERGWIPTIKYTQTALKGSTSGDSGIYYIVISECPHPDRMERFTIPQPSRGSQNATCAFVPYMWVRRHQM